MVLSYGEFFSDVLSRLKLWDNLLWGQRMWHSTAQNSIQLHSFVLVIYIYNQCEMGNLANCATVGSGPVVIRVGKSVLDAGWWDACLNNKKRQNIRERIILAQTSILPHYLLLKLIQTPASCSVMCIETTRFFCNVSM